MARWHLPLLLISILIPGEGHAQAAGTDGGRVRLFLDCRLDCDQTFLRTELRLVEWVTDRTVADVHVIATQLSTGAGGSEVTLEFIGLAALAGLNDTVSFQTPFDASDDDERREFVRVLRLGLVRYLLAARQTDNLTLLVDGEALPPSTETSAADPWNHWVFSVGGDFEFDAESQETQYQIGGSLSANRTTADWKLRLRFNGEIDRTTFTLEDGEEYRARRDGWEAYGLAARSVGAHLSLGATAETGASRPNNFDLRLRVAPAAEWDLFPYDEVTRRQLILVYSVGLMHYDYVERTIYERIEETRLDHQLQLAFEARQPWGSARLGGSASTFLSDWSQNRLSASGGIEVRLARGLSVDIEASYARVRDQITLRKGDASDEEIFLRLRELSTDYEAGIQFGLSYTFGSFSNSIVNPRFDEVD